MVSILSFHRAPWHKRERQFGIDRSTRRQSAERELGWQTRKRKGRVVGIGARDSFKHAIKGVSKVRANPIVGSASKLFYGGIFNVNENHVLWVWIIYLFPQTTA